MGELSLCFEFAKFKSVLFFKKTYHQILRHWRLHHRADQRPPAEGLQQEPAAALRREAASGERLVADNRHQRHLRDDHGEANLSSVKKITYSKR